MSLRRRLVACALAGLASGFLVLGVAGRGLMRVLAFTTPEDPRFTLLGTLEIIGLGAAWGLITGPLLLPTRARVGRRAAGIVCGLIAFVLAAVPFALYSGFRGGLVAPRLFLWLSALAFPALFVLHGVAVDWLVDRWALGD